jgi:hypothetical protein
MKSLKWCLPVLAVGFAGCSAEHSDPKGGESESVGTLEFALTGTDSSGRQYRLRNAEFEVYGYSYYGDGYTPPTILSSEEDPNAPYISRTFVPGDYYVNFLSYDWYLERLGTDGGYEPVQQAVLLSQRWQYAYLWDNSTSYVFYRFGVDGELIDFRHADLNIGIEIEQPGENNGSGGFGSVDGGAVGGGGGMIGTPDPIP